MIVGGYQISNALVAILLVASTTGAGVATDSFSGLDDFTTPLSDPSENITDVNETDTDDSQDSSGEGTQDSSSDGSSDSDSGDSGGSDQDSPDSSDDNNQQDSESEDSSDEEGGFLDNILGNEEENGTEENSTDDSVDQVDDTENVTDDNTTGTGTEGTENNTDSTQNDTTTAEIISFSAPRDSQFYDPYESTSVPLEAELTGNNVEYEVILNGETNTAGNFSGTETINTSLTLSDTGSHEITLEITQSGSTVNSITRTFEIADSAIQQTGFSKTTTIRTGSEAGFRLLDNGEPVEDASISLDGTQTANTNADGEFTVQVPYQDTIKLSTGYSGIPGQEFNVTQDIPEPETTLIGPNDLDSFDTPTGTNRDVTFEASIDITEDSGTASLMIDGSETYTQDLSSGTNSISTTQALAGGTHTWQVDVDTPEHKVSSSSRSLTVNEVEVQNGLSLQSDPVVREQNTVVLYEDGEPVEGQEITVNGDSVGSTDQFGEVGFEVPETEQITVSSGTRERTLDVDGIVLSFTKELMQSKENTLQVKANGSLSENWGVIVAGENVGSTNSSGQISFDIPREGSFEILVEKGNQSYTEMFAADRPPIMLELNSPQDGEDINSYKALFNVSLSLLESGTITLKANNNVIRDQELLDGSSQITEEVSYVNSGTRSFEVTVESDSETVTRTGSFTTSQDMPAPEININAPIKDSSISSYKTNAGIVVDSPDDFQYSLEVDGRKISEGTRLQSQDNIDKEITCLESGSHQLEISATGESTGKETIETVNFESTEPRPIADLEIISPQQGETIESPIRPAYELTACEQNVEGRMEYYQNDNRQGTLKQSDLGQFETMEESKPTPESASVSQGVYDVVLKAVTNSDSVNVTNEVTVQ